MVKILAIDQSLSNTGYSVFVDGFYKKSGSFKFSVVDAKCNICVSERLCEIKNNIVELIDEYSGFDYIIIEGYSYSQNSSALTGLYELGGILKLIAYEYNCKLIIIAPTLAKKFLNMNDKYKEGKETGLSNKEITYIAIKNKYQKFDFKDDDEADAFNFMYILKEYFKYLKNPQNYNRVEVEVFLQLSEQLKVIDDCKGNHYKIK